jgi:hypothetical protein
MIMKIRAPVIKKNLGIIKDWCHVCGKRRSPLADVHFSKNAENLKDVDKYFRICPDCTEMIYKALNQ